MDAQLRELTQQLKQINGEMEKALTTSPLASSTHVQEIESAINNEVDQYKRLKEAAEFAKIREASEKEEPTPQTNAWGNPIIPFDSENFGGKSSKRKTLRRRRNTLRRKKNKGRVHVRR